MSDENIFNDDGTTKPPVGEVQPPTVILPDNVKELVGPGKKYATVEKALEALVHSQNHISTLEQEQRLLREKAEKALTTEQVYETMQELLRKERETLAPVSLDEATLSGVLDRKLEERDTAKVQKANVDAVTSALKEKYGDKAQEVYDAKAKELGVGVGFLNSVSKQSAQAALELFGLKPKAPSGPAHVRGSINTEGFNNVQRAVDKPTKSPMSGASTKELMGAWDYAKHKATNGE